MKPFFIMRTAAEQDRQEAAGDWCQAQKEAVLLLSVYVAEMIYYLGVQAASKYQAIQQERLLGPQIIWL